MYTSLFKTLQLTEKNLSPYVGNELYGFNGSSTQPWGYVELLVTFNEKEAKKTIRIPFLVIDCPSLYNCIIGRTELAHLGAACSTAHLKLKYHAKNGIIASLNGDIEATKRCFLQANKTRNSFPNPAKLPTTRGKLPRVLWIKPSRARPQVLQGEPQRAEKGKERSAQHETS